jgi:MoaA/NifB/PqqE/SkfB family radical SAM enzyme
MGWRKDKLGRWRLSYRCDACDRSLKKVEAAPMLHDHVWLEIAAGLNLLCEHCARQRAKHYLGRDLTLADLHPCAFNMNRSPPWFVVLTPGNMTPDLHAQWVVVIAQGKAGDEN